MCANEKERGGEKVRDRKREMEKRKGRERAREKEKERTHAQALPESPAARRPTLPVSFPISLHASLARQHLASRRTFFLLLLLSLVLSRV